ncbi:MAG: HU family DNA-binding protein [Immundisolibacterales bacterium]|nr:HU family DNA-binding protein [Immundisolibacterales bacterium]
MKKSDLSAHVAAQASMTQAQAAGVVDAVFSTISDALARDESVAIPGFGM